MRTVIMSERTQERWTISVCPECGARQIWPYSVDMATPAPLHCNGGFSPDHPSQAGHRLTTCEIIEVAPAHLLDTAIEALRGLYDSLPRYSCKADAPDGCPVCVARSTLTKLERGTE